MGLATLIKLKIFKMLWDSIMDAGTSDAKMERCRVCGRLAAPELLRDGTCIRCRLADEAKTGNQSREKHENHRPREGGITSLGQAYGILGCKASDSDAVIKKSYRDLAKQCHPDSLPSWASHRVQEANGLFRELNEAYELVMSTRKGS